MRWLDPSALARSVREFVAGAPPGVPRDALSRLDEAAGATLEGTHFAAHLPAGPKTWEASFTLRGSDIESPQQLYSFARPVRLVGLYASLVPVGAGGNIATLDEIALSLGFEGAPSFTEARDLDDQAASDFVTLAALHSRSRLFVADLEGARPELRIKARWKNPAGAYRDTQISLALFGAYTR